MFALSHKEEAAHSDAIWTCQWRECSDENGRRSAMVTGSLDNTAKIWYCNDDGVRCAHTLEGHQLGIVSSDISADGALAVTASTECSIRVWNLADGEQTLHIDAAPMDSWQVKFSPGGQMIATGTAGGKVNLYNTVTGEKQATLESSGKFLLSVAFNNSGDQLFAASQEGIVYLFDLATQKLIRNFECHAMPIRCMKFMPDTQLLLTGSDDKYVKVHDILEASQQIVASLPGHSSWVLDVDASSKHKQIASASADGTVRVWDLGERQMLHCFKEHTDQVWGVSYNGDGSKLMSVSEDKSMNVYSIPVS